MYLSKLLAMALVLSPTHTAYITTDKTIHLTVEAYDDWEEPLPTKSKNYYQYRGWFSNIPPNRKWEPYNPPPSPKGGYYTAWPPKDITRWGNDHKFKYNSHIPYDGSPL